MNIKDELLRVIDTLNEARIEYAIAGGLAVAIHGCPRLTVDIDLAIREDELDGARRALAAIGFDLESGSVHLSPGPAAVERLFRLTKTEHSEYLTLDLLLVTVHDDLLMADREAFEVGGRTMWVVSRRGLIEMKRCAGRAQDLADIAALEAESPKP